MSAAAWLLLAATFGAAVGSEYPERECCDPVNVPQPPASAPATPSLAAAAGRETTPQPADVQRGKRFSVAVTESVGLPSQEKNRACGF